MLFESGDGNDYRRRAIEGVNGRPSQFCKFHGSREKRIGLGWDRRGKGCGGDQSSWRMAAMGAAPPSQILTGRNGTKLLPTQKVWPSSRWRSSLNTQRIVGHRRRLRPTVFRNIRVLRVAATFASATRMIAAGFTLGPRKDRELSTRTTMNPEIAKIVNGENMPSPPTIAARLLDLVNQPDARIADITKVISADPKLSAKLIDYCNSPIVASARTVGSLQQAIPLLGMRTLRLLSLSFSVMDTRGHAGFPYEEFWRRSLATAIAAKLIAKQAEQNADESFLLGLVFNIGAMGIGNAYTDALAERFELDELLDKLSTTVEREICGADRYEVGACLLEKWNFPQPMIDALATYDPDEPNLTTKLFLVSQLVGKLLLSSDPDNREIFGARKSAGEFLGIDEAQFDCLFDEMIAEWKGYETLFQFETIAFESIHDLESRAKESMVQISLGMERTIREMSEQQQELRELALLDSLTQLKNRSAFDAEVFQVSNEFRRESKSFGLIIADIDHFKTFNDTYGHAAGDCVLREVAACLKHNCRQYDTVYRFGGEEFVVLVGDCDYESTLKVAERLRKAIEELQVDYGNNCLCVTTSMGICWVDRGRHDGFNSLFEKADASLYEAKRKGRNNCVAITAAPSLNPVINATASPTVQQSASYTI